MVEYTPQLPSSVSKKVLIEGAQDLFGKDALQGLVENIFATPGILSDNGADKPQDGSAIFRQPEIFFQKFEEIYGITGGRGLALRIGRAAFHHGLKQLGEQAGLKAFEYRFLPAPRRMQAGLSQIARVVSQEFGDEIQIRDEGSSWLWQSENCSLCRGRQSQDPCCYLTVGFLQEFMSWSSGGRFFRVVETNCRAAKDAACVYRIEKKPLD